MTSQSYLLLYEVLKLCRYTQRQHISQVQKIPYMHVRKIFESINILSVSLAPIRPTVVPGY